MKGIARNIKIFCMGLTAVFLVDLCFVHHARAEDVYLNPGYISGNISLGDVVIDQASVSALNSEYHAYLNTQNSTYTLTVNTPEGGSLEYEMNGHIYSDNYKDYLYYPDGLVTVYDGQTTIFDMALTPGFVKGNITLGEECSSIERGRVFVYGAGSYFDNTGTFSFPVIPGEGIELRGSVETSVGEQIILDNKLINVEPGKVTDVQWNVPCVMNATIYGKIVMIGAEGAGTHEVRAINQDTGSSSYADIEYTADGTNYILDNLTPGTWKIYAYSSYNEGDDELRHPESSFAAGDVLTIAAGETLTNDIITLASFVNGSISLSGIKGIKDVSSGYIFITNPDFSYSEDRISVIDGSFDLLAHAGDWNIGGVYLNIHDTYSECYLNNVMSIYNISNLLPSLRVAAGEEVNNIDFAFETGIVTVRFTVENQGILSSPRLVGSGIDRSREYAQVKAYGAPEETTEGRVTFVGLPGEYNLYASAYVGGSRTSFGRLQVEVIPGGERDMDIGGPDLAIDSPQPETYTDEDSILVSGKTTDGDAIKSVTVNGEGVEMVSTGNPDDPEEVSFSKVVPLERGPNAVTVMATDHMDKMTSDTRRVFRDSGPPVIAWTPDNGSIAYDAAITVSGTATDDNAVTEVKVNGQSVELTPAGNPEDPNEVIFSSQVTLQDGDNQIVVSATDNCELVTSETHTVTKSNEDRIPPSITCPADLTLTEGEEVSLGVPTVDDNQDPSPWVRNNAPAKFSVGETTVTWTATDEAGNSGSCTQKVTVEKRKEKVVSFTAEPSTSILWPPNHKYVAIDIDLEAFTESGRDIAEAARLLSVTSDEAEDAQELRQIRQVRRLVKVRNRFLLSFRSLKSKAWQYRKRARKVSSARVTRILLKRSRIFNERARSLVGKVHTLNRSIRRLNQQRLTRGDGRTYNDIVIIDNDTVKVRAERLGGGNGRVYTFNYEITDEAGNTLSCSARVGVPLSVKRKPVDSGARYVVRP